MYIAVVGAGKCDMDTEKLAHQVGKLIAQNKAILVCGGLGGVMNAAARGAKEAGGVAVGILPSDTRAGASRYLEVAIATGLGEARNAIITRCADAVIAVGGEHGTLSEIGLALKMGKPVIGLNTWQLAREGKEDLTVKQAKTPEEAVNLAINTIYDDPYCPR
jgi:uncharacterized protein (TIGR00725 family)